MSPPNLLFIYADEQAVSRLATYGNARIQMPRALTVYVLTLVGLIVAGVRPLRLHAHEQHQETGNSTEKKRLHLALCRAIATRLDYRQEIATHRN